MSVTKSQIYKQIILYQITKYFLKEQKSKKQSDLHFCRIEVIDKYIKKVLKSGNEKKMCL